MVSSKSGKSKRAFTFWGLLLPSFRELRNSDPLRMAGATAFFTSFALPPILIILFQMLSLFLSRKLVGSEIMLMLTNTLGPEGAMQIRETTKGFRTLAQNWYTALFGFLFLLFVATTLFTVIKNTFNDIWGIRVKERPGFLFNLRLRLRSMGVILLAGALLLVAIFLDSFEMLRGNYLNLAFPKGGWFFKSAMNELVAAIIVTVWFIGLFRYLADGRPSWKAAVYGGILTGVLFSAGRALLSFLMRHSNVRIIYGASGSIVLILLFVFYSSFILYYGASFIKVYTAAIGQDLRTGEMAFRYKMNKVN